MDEQILNISSLQEFLSVIEDIKPVMRIGFDVKNKTLMMKICKDHKLHLLIKTLDFKRSAKDKIKIFYISRSEKLAKEAYKAEIERDYRKLGKLLGYPQCCIDYFENEIPYLHNDKFSFILHINSRTTGKPSFYINNIFNYQSRLHSAYRSAIVTQNKNVFNKINRYYIISHVPCSYDCKESIILGEKILKLIKKESPNFAEETVHALKNIFLVFDDFNWVCFEGVAKNKCINYNRLLPFGSIYPEEKFKLGNRVILDKDSKEILIMNENQKIESIKLDTCLPVIIDFSQ